MGPEDFNAVIDETLSRLPEWVHDAMENIAIEVLDAPDESFAEYGEDLLGLYVGVPLTEREGDNAGELPDVVYIFREPHLAMNLPPDELQQEIACTLIHEIAHYFGIDDDRLEELGWD